jgi:hypothetical protein
MPVFGLPATCIVTNEFEKDFFYFGNTARYRRCRAADDAVPTATKLTDERTMQFEKTSGGIWLRTK